MSTLIHAVLSSVKVELHWLQHNLLLTLIAGLLLISLGLSYIAYRPTSTHNEPAPTSTPEEPKE